MFSLLESFIILENELVKLSGNDNFVATVTLIIFIANLLPCK